jgi:hypothetical protein
MEIGRTYQDADAKMAVTLTPEQTKGQRTHSRSPHRVRAVQITSPGLQGTIMGMQGVINDLGDQIQSIRGLHINSAQVHTGKPAPSNRPTGGIKTAPAQGRQGASKPAMNSASGPNSHCKDCGSYHASPCRFMVNGTFNMEALVQTILSNPQPERYLKTVLYEHWPRSRHFMGANRQEANKLRELVAKGLSKK